MCSSWQENSSNILLLENRHTMIKSIMDMPHMASDNFRRQSVCYLTFKIWLFAVSRIRHNNKRKPTLWLIPNIFVSDSSNASELSQRCARIVQKTNSNHIQRRTYDALNH